MSGAGSAARALRTEGKYRRVAARARPVDWGPGSLHRYEWALFLNHQKAPACFAGGMAHNFDLSA
jgi:hypothetical protein